MNVFSYIQRYLNGPVLVYFILKVKMYDVNSLVFKKCKLYEKLLFYKHNCGWDIQLFELNNSNDFFYPFEILKYDIIELFSISNSSYLETVVEEDDHTVTQI